MLALARVRSAFERLLEWITILLMTSLAVVVIAAIFFRAFGHPLVWYDEIASIMLAWLTYYVAALAALKRMHIGFPGLVQAMPRPIRLWVILFGEFCVIGFFVVLAWTGMEVWLILEGDNLISLPGVSTQVTQSVIPIGAVLFIVAQLLSLPEVLRHGPQVHH